MRPWCKTRAVPTPLRSAERLMPPGEGSGDDEPAPFRGWHESSWDLRRGLAVAEVQGLEEAVWRLVNGEELAAA